MNMVNAIYRNGRIELFSEVSWPDGTPVQVMPVPLHQPRTSWLSLSPLDVGAFHELSSDDDLLDELLDDSRN